LISFAKGVPWSLWPWELQRQADAKTRSTEWDTETINGILMILMINRDSMNLDDDDDDD